MRSIVSLVALVAMLLVGATAQADVPPEPDSADAHCTLAEQCPGGVECPSGLRQDAGAIQACMDKTKAKGLAYRCHRGGNYFGTAVYCSPDAGGSWTPPTPNPPPPAPPISDSTTPPATAAPAAPPPSRGHCAVSPGPSSSAPFALAAAALALLLVRRRR
jgi:MYXO-CTERM domain-containing protein